MTFASPHLLYWLLALPVLAVLRLWAGMRAGRIIQHWTAPRLRPQLVSGVSRWRTQTIFTLQLLALACLITALAQPRWREDKVEQFDSGRNVILAVDTSRSMLANDLPPNRLARVRLAAQDILAELPTDRVGLIAFSGNAYLQAPLTTDHEAMVEAIQSLDFTSVPRGGSEIAKALTLAMETFEKNPARNHGLILFSDGGEPDAEVKKAAEAAAKKNVLVVTVGVGTDSGSLIPDPDPDRPGDFIRDQEGNVVRSRLESGALQQIATATRGRYLKLGTQAISTSVVKSVLASLEAQRNASKELTKPIERFQWPLALGVFLLMIAWLIRPARSRAQLVSPAALPAAPAAVALALPGLVLCGLLVTAAPAQAASTAADTGAVLPERPVGRSWLASLFNPRAETQTQAEAALKAGDHKEAIKLLDQLLEEEPASALRYRYAQALGFAAHKEADYDRAVEAFSQALESEEPALQKQAHNGLAHTLYDQGDRQVAKLPKTAVKNWRDSIRHFDSALKQDPDNKELKENRDFVKSRLKELEQQIAEQEQKEQGQGQKKKGQKGQKGEKGEEGEGEEGEEGENGDQDLSRKESRGKKEDGEGEEGQGKEEELPEGDIKAMKPEESGAEEGQEKPGEEAGNADKADERTGYTPNEARALLRNYADEHKRARDVRPRREPANGKDW